MHFHPRKLGQRSKTTIDLQKTYKRPAKDQQKTYQKMVIYSSVCSELPAASNILACLRLKVYQFQVFSLYFASAAIRCHYKECVGALIDSVEDPDPGFVRGGFIEGLSTWIRIYFASTARRCH